MAWRARASDFAGTRSIVLSFSPFSPPLFSCRWRCLVTRPSHIPAHSNLNSWSDIIVPQVSPSISNGDAVLGSSRHVCVEEEGKGGEEILHRNQSIHGRCVLVTKDNEARLLFQR